jgi:hypothetical protein
MTGLHNNRPLSGFFSPSRTFFACSSNIGRRLAADPAFRHAARGVSYAPLIYLPTARVQPVHTQPFTNSRQRNSDKMRHGVIAICYADMFLPPSFQVISGIQTPHSSIYDERLSNWPNSGFVSALRNFSSANICITPYIRRARATLLVYTAPNIGLFDAS